MIERLSVTRHLLRGNLHVTTQQAVSALFLNKSKQSRQVLGQYASFLVRKQLADSNVVVAGGHKATINNPDTSEEAKQNAQERLAKEDF
ncbi:conidiation-specific 6 [Fusarium coicis]|nr:conidiation-specific 6 [Fusarium coicis]